MQLPVAAAWRHHGAREGFESVFIRAIASGYRFDGLTCAVESGEPWAVRYSITVDERWATRTARVWGWSMSGERETWIKADGAGRWAVDGRPAPALDGCLDVDLESSALTNTFPVHRLDLRRGQSEQTPAAYVRAPDLHVERLDQRYTRLDEDGPPYRYDYDAPVFDFHACLVYDASHVAVEYPGIATRVELASST